MGGVACCQAAPMFGLVTEAMRPAFTGLSTNSFSCGLIGWSNTPASCSSASTAKKTKLSSAPAVPVWSSRYVPQQYDGQDSGDGFNGNFSPSGNGDNVGAFSSWSALGSGAVEMGGY